VHCCSAYLTFVALDGHGGKRPVPELDDEGDVEVQRRWREAALRRSARLQVREARRLEQSGG
jgi:acyl-CoA hydrolase